MTEGFWILHFQQLQHLPIWHIRIFPILSLPGHICASLGLNGQLVENSDQTKITLTADIILTTSPPHPSSPFTRHNCQWIKSWKTPVLFYEYMTFICYQNTYFLPQMFQSLVILYLLCWCSAGGGGGLGNVTEIVFHRKGVIWSAIC